MADGIPVLAPIPTGDGPKRAHVKMRRNLARIARRVAVAAILEGREDVLLEVYCAGAAHATAILQRQRDEGEGTQNASS